MSVVKKLKPTLTLYTNPQSRGWMIEWYLQELGIQAAVVNLDFKTKEHKAPEFREVNPFGAVPGLQDEDVSLFESGAILLYLSEKYGPATTLQQRARTAAWTHFANASVCAIVFAEEFRKMHAAEAMGTLNRILGEQEYLEGSFSAADVAVGGYLLFIPTFTLDLDMTPYPNVIRYMHRLIARPACSSTLPEMGPEGPLSLKNLPLPADAEAPTAAVSPTAAT